MITSCNNAEPPPDGVDTAALVADARNGCDRAWTALFERFLPVIRAVARGYQLGDSDIEDVGQTVWVQLLEHVDRIREPRALPGWLITTTRRESLRLIRQQRRTVLVDPLASVYENETETTTASTPTSSAWRRRGCCWRVSPSSRPCSAPFCGCSATSRP